MTFYKKILIAVDPFIDNTNLVKKARHVSGPGAHLELVYVMDLEIFFPTAPFATPMIDVPGIQQKTKETAKKTLKALAQEHNIPEDNVHILIGSVAKEIRDRAAEIEADAIVIGSHGRHGLGLLLGSTASSVIHGLPCDTLVVKIKKNEK